MLECTAVVYCGALMRARTTSGKSRTSVRISVTFSPEDYAELQRLAERKRVSLAWVVRDAVERCLEEEMPLFLKSKKASR